MVGRVIPSITQLIELLTVSPYLPLVYYTTGMANLKKGCLLWKLYEAHQHTLWAKYRASES